MEPGIDQDNLFFLWRLQMDSKRALAKKRKTKEDTEEDEMPNEVIQLIKKEVVSK
jgi:hypothetical protein